MFDAKDFGRVTFVSHEAGAAAVFFFILFQDFLSRPNVPDVEASGPFKMIFYDQILLLGDC